MTLTSLIRKLESQLKKAETLAHQYDSHADTIREKLTGVAEIVGKKFKLAMEGGGEAMGKIGRRGMSAAGRALIQAAQKKRWAAFYAKRRKKVKGRKKRHKMSAAGRASIARAQRARWAAFHAKHRKKKRS